MSLLATEGVRSRRRLSILRHTITRQHPLENSVALAAGLYALLRLNRIDGYGGAVAIEIVDVSLTRQPPFPTPFFQTAELMHTRAVAKVI